MPINKCELCGGEYQTLTGQVVHFESALSGVENVYLENMMVEQCVKCGDVSPYFPVSDEFFNTIARAVVLQPFPLSGGAIRMLRKNRKTKAKDFAALLGIDPATLSRWEDDKQVRTPQNDRLIRLVYVQLFVEQEKQSFPETVTDKISAQSETEPVIYINTQKPMTYRYEMVKEMAAK
jgi:DNA-binding transcriptional regulator YiaG